MAFGKKLNLIPTASLLRAVQDPKYAVSIDVPGFAALDELQQRKIKGENLKLAMAQAPQQTVKDQTVAEYQPGLPRPQAVASAPTEMPQQPVQPATPQQEMPVDEDRAMPTMTAAEGGIIDLPARYNPIPESTYARGGIVAFAAGGAPEFQLPAAPSYDMTLYDEMLAANPRRTLEEVEAEEERRRQARGIDIKGMYERQLKGLQEEKEAVKKSFETNKALAGLEFAGEMLKSTSPFFGPGLGAGATAFAKSYGAAEKEMQGANRQLRREENAMDVAKTNMDMAMMKGDRDEYNQQLNRYQTAATNKQNLLNKMEETRYAGELKKAEEEFGYKKSMDVAGVQAATARNTDTKRLIDGQYQLLLSKGYPANAETYAMAQQRAYDMIGKVSGSSKFDLEKFGADVKFESAKQEAITKAEANKNSPLSAAKLNLVKVQNTTKDQAKIDAAQAAYDQEKAKIVKPIEDAFNKAKVGYQSSGAGLADVPEFKAPPVPEPKVKDTGARVDKPVQSKFVEDGHVFPDKASLEKYRKAKANLNKAK